MIELPGDERYASSIHGKVLAHSHFLRTAIRIRIQADCSQFRKLRTDALDPTPHSMKEESSSKEELSYSGQAFGSVAVGSK